MDLKTEQYRYIYGLFAFWPLWARHLLLGTLVAIETWWIKQKVTKTVDQTIKEVEPLLPVSGVDPPVYSETGSGFFDEMRLTAPWKAQEDPSDSP